MFPRSKFIHIVRHPDNVIPSTIYMWDIVQQQNRLNFPVNRPDFTETVGVLVSLLAAIETDRMQLQPGHFVEIRFEDLEKNPVDVLKKIYHLLDLQFTSEFEANIQDFVRETVDFRKNEFSLTPREKSFIREKLILHMKNHDYQ